MGKSKTRECNRCRTQVVVAAFNNSTIAHQCPHGRGCGIVYPRCPECDAGAPAQSKAGQMALSFDAKKETAQELHVDYEPDEFELPVRPASPNSAPYVVGSETSKRAAESVEAGLNQMQEQVLAAIRSDASGRTCDEVERVLALRHQTASARIRELACKSKIVDSGRRRVTRSGRAAVVWVLKPCGSEERL